MLHGTLCFYHNNRILLYFIPVGMAKIQNGFPNVTECDFTGDRNTAPWMTPFCPKKSSVETMAQISEHRG